MIRRPTLIALAIVVAPSPVMADILNDIAGDWRGSGWARQMPSDPKEPVRCRLYATYFGNDGRLTLDGLCSLAGQKFPIKGDVIRAPFGAIAATLQNPAGVGMIDASGTADEDRLSLRFDAAAPGAERPVPQEMTWVSKDGNLSFEIARLDGERAEVIAVEFQSK